jgi:hypothetical protein
VGTLGIQPQADSTEVIDDDNVMMSQGIHKAGDDGGT